MPGESMDEHELAARLNALFPGLPGDCGNETRPGTDESPGNRDWSQRSTTRDQARIERVLEGMLTPFSRILHIGIGNSSLASRFCGQERAICGLTLSQAELAHARSLQLPGYDAKLINKYGREFMALAGDFDFIIDNNPTTFACCNRHFARMMLACRARLAQDGLMLTDKTGLAHLASDDPQLGRWSFSESDWKMVAQTIAMTTRAHGEHVLALGHKTNMAA